MSYQDVYQFYEEPEEDEPPKFNFWAYAGSRYVAHYFVNQDPCHPTSACGHNFKIYKPELVEVQKLHPEELCKKCLKTYQRNL